MAGSNAYQAMVICTAYTSALALVYLAGVTRSQEIVPTGRAESNGTSSSSFITGAASSTVTVPSSPTLAFVEPMKNYSKTVGDSLKVRCVVRGDPPVVRFKWFKNEAPLEEERGRVRIRSKTDETGTQWSRVRFQDLETMDMGFYRCEANNGIDTITAETVIKIHPGNKRKGTSYWRDDEYDSDYHGLEDGGHDGLIPESFPLDLDDHSLSGIGGFSGTHIEFQGRAPDDFGNRGQGGGVGHPGLGPGSGPAVSNVINGNVPSLKPNERAGHCQKYTGSVCREHLSNNYIFVSQGLTQDYIEQKLQASLQVIKNSAELSKNCGKYAIPAICLSTLPLCDTRTQKPKKICRDECEVLEYQLCQKELAIARSQPMISHQLVLPDCKELPVIGSADNYNCVRLGLVKVGQQIKPHHSCYRDDGSDYRGTVSVTVSGQTCKPWHLSLDAGNSHGDSFNSIELMGGHNYCRNPTHNGQKEDQPWCFTNDPRHHKEVCGVPECSDFNLWLYVVIPVAGASVLVSLILVFCCVRRKNKKNPGSGGLTTISLGASSPRSLITQPSHHNYSEMEMNALIPKSQPPPPKPRVREFAITSVRFNQELGEGAFGKVYRGDLGGIVGASTVAIKTLRPGANSKVKEDFHQEVEMWSELRHNNIICLLGTVLKDDPQCMIFEYLSQGDLHEFLLCHCPKSDMLTSVSDDDVTERILDPADMSFMAIQIAAGMEYLASHHYVHRDLAARNCLVDEKLTVKISDFGMARDKYKSDYYRVQSKSLLPVRWMPPESMLYGKFTTESDVWSYGVMLWEIYSYGLQPYYGYTDQEIIDMIRTRQLLPCPEDCPSRMYAFMVECWHEVPSRRPSFAEIHARLRHWEGMSAGYQSTTHSMCNASQHSGSQHSSTGPSNNTGSTNLSQQQRLNNGGCTNNGYSQPFCHLVGGGPTMGNGGPVPPVGMVQMANGPKGGPQTLLLGPNHAGFGSHIGPLGHATSLSQNGGQAASVASLQMV